MAVKKADRHKSRSECLEKSRKLVVQALSLTRPAMENDDGSHIKPGPLGYGQPFYAFGNDIMSCAKKVHAECYKATEIYIKEKEDMDKRNEYFHKALEYCDSILRQLDLCIFAYAQNNKKKRKSFYYMARLTNDQKSSIYDRMNLDTFIVKDIQAKRQAKKS